MSVRPSMTRSPVACSGLMYCGVPNESPVCVMRVPPALLTASAMPKSATSGWPVVEQDVLRLEVAVDHVVAVRVVERTRDRGRDANGFVDRQLLLAIESRAQRFAFDERHHVEQQLPSASPESNSGSRFGCCRFAVTWISARNRSTPSTAPSSGLQHLERDLALVPQVAREVDGRHAALADQSVDGVAAGRGRNSGGRCAWGARNKLRSCGAGQLGPSRYRMWDVGCGRSHADS